LTVKGIIKKGQYYDSVSLMIVARQVTEMEGVTDAAVVMGTEGNKSILETSNLLITKFQEASDTDLLIIIKAENDKIVSEALKRVDRLLEKLKDKKEDAGEYLPKSLDTAVKVLPGANMAIISVAGKYAGYEALKALNNGLHVMIFSDNVDIETEIKLKRLAIEKGLYVMGPDCGTAIINGIPLAFANEVNRGDIGIVAASGTGLQEISSIISNQGAGISQGLGTGGRDVKEKVGGLMFIEGLKSLIEDENTKIIVLVSKPPAKSVQEKVAGLIKDITKPVVTIFLGGDPSIMKNAGAITASTLEEAALKAAYLSAGRSLEEVNSLKRSRSIEIEQIASDESGKITPGQVYIRGLFSGGTLCYESQLILKDSLGNTYSNVPINKEFKLADSSKSFEHCLIDLGEDEFTSGRPHPMIDYSLRNKWIIREANDPEVAVIMLDVVLGHGSNLEPAEELENVIKSAIEIAKNGGRHLSIICSITGTNKDPQDRKDVEKRLEAAGAIVMPTNAAATELASQIIEKSGGAA